ncbi:pre translocase subunit, putative [Babesia ovata]|uniref:Pre translocase subunit, putative n=1 Tax=Babesia ovata TaxID=189622 RepID=A0A2H6K7Y7_9APIC|nr:pre translocase subunit, putative [Babesia ovata]GBE59069.1 pre translocase subunit, putative [Babesia ovata]
MQRSRSWRPIASSCASSSAYFSVPASAVSPAGVVTSAGVTVAPVTFGVGASGGVDAASCEVGAELLPTLGLPDGAELLEPDPVAPEAPDDPKDPAPAFRIYGLSVLIKPKLFGDSLLLDDPRLEDIGSAESRLARPPMFALLPRPPRPPKEEGIPGEAEKVDGGVAHGLGSASTDSFSLGSGSFDLPWRLGAAEALWPSFIIACQRGCWMLRCIWYSARKPPGTASMFLQAVSACRASSLAISGLVAARITWFIRSESAVNSRSMRCVSDKRMRSSFSSSLSPDDGW